MELEATGHFYRKIIKYKLFYQNLSSGSRAAPCGRTDTHDEAFRSFCEKILKIKGVSETYKLCGEVPTFASWLTPVFCDNQDSRINLKLKIWRVRTIFIPSRLYPNKMIALHSKIAFFLRAI